MATSAGPGPTGSRRAYAHDAVVVLAPDGDERAPGGAITVALCGSWSHDPPCPLAPHHTAVDRSGDRVHLRILFATEPSNEGVVRTLLEQALARGWADDPHGIRTRWRLVRARASAVRPQESEQAARLAQG